MDDKPILPIAVKGLELFLSKKIVDIKTYLIVDYSDVQLLILLKYAFIC